MLIAKFVPAALLAASVISLPASAFTYDSRTNQGTAAALRQSDQAPANGTIGNSRFSMKFSGGMNSSQPSGLENRFVPSSNPAFSSPFSGPNNLDLALGNRH